MSADRELLELAAKAAGIEYEILEGWSGPVVGYGMASRVWNPLTDDGDALRLAVKLNIRLVEFKETIVKSCAVAWREGPASCSLWEPEGADPCAATRRAIVRAAAEIGQGLP